MPRTPKIFLAASIVLFTLGHLPFFREIGYGMLKPAGAVLFIPFFITQVLAKEMALFDEEHVHATDQKHVKSGSITERGNSSIEGTVAHQR